MLARRKKVGYGTCVSRRDNQIYQDCVTRDFSPISCDTPGSWCVLGDEVTALAVEFMLEKII